MATDDAGVSLYSSDNVAAAAEQSRKLTHIKRFFGSNPFRGLQSSGESIYEAHSSFGTA